MCAGGDTGNAGIGTKLPGETHARCVYVDYNATTPVFPEVATAMAPFLYTHCGNPSSDHAFGRPCRDAVQLARRQVASLVNAEPEEIVCVLRSDARDAPLYFLTCVYAWLCACATLTD